MPTAFKSDQQTKLAATPRQLLNPTELGGRVRRGVFTHTLAGTMAIGDTIDLITLPKGARILGGQFSWSAGQGVTATTAIGKSGDAGRYFAAAVTNSTAINRIADTQAQNTLDDLTAETVLLATNAAAAWTVALVLKGFVDFIVD